MAWRRIGRPEPQLELGGLCVRLPLSVQARTTFEIQGARISHIDHHHLRPASADSHLTVKMLIPKADRKKIHELVLLYEAPAQRNLHWNFARNHPLLR